MEKNYCINDSLRIFDNGENEIRFKLGLWNYNEAVLNLSKEDDEFKEALRKVINKLRLGEKINKDFLEDLKISKDNKTNLINMLDGLVSAGMITTEKERALSNEITTALLGDYRYLLKDGLENKKNRKLLFVTDNSFSKKMAKILIDEMELNIDIIDEDLYSKIREKDLTSNINALEILTDIENLKSEIKEYEGIVICFKRPELMTIRNINKLATEKEIPVICSFIDGPFITALSTNYPKTGCLECFGERTLSRLEDHVSYHNFENFKFSKETKDINKGIIPILNIITNLVMAEAFLLSNYGTCKFENRVLNIYVPTLEIQVQDLLRVPYCPTCGNVARAKFQELNVSSRTVVDNILDNLR